METVGAAQDLDAPVAEQLVASLLERERSVLAPLAERWWTLYVALEECCPGEIEAFHDSLDTLTTDRFPVREPAVAQLGDVRLELGFRESFPEDLVIATVESNGVVPNLSGNVNRPVQMLQLLGLEEVEFERLTHEKYVAYVCRWRKRIDIQTVVCL